MATLQAKLDQLEQEIKLVKREFYLTQEVTEQEIKHVLDQKNFSFDFLLKIKDVSLIQSKLENSIILNNIKGQLPLYYIHIKSGGSFDHEIFEQLIDRMHDKIKEQSFKTMNWKNFFLTYIEAEDQLKQKISNAKKILEDCFQKKGEVEGKLIEARTSEVLNQHGIAFNSHLTVTVRSISLNVPSNVQPYVQIQVGPNQTHQTSNAFGNQAQFNNTFEFKIVTGHESIQINVMNYDRASQDSLLGSVTIPLSFLKDQYPRENAYELLGYDKNEIGTIFLSLQWLHSQEKYLTDTLVQWDEHIKQQEEDLYDFQKDLSTLYIPFGQYVSLFRNDINGMQQNQYLGSNIAYKLEDKPGVQFGVQPEYEKIDLRGVALQGVIEVDKNIFQHVTILIGIFFILTLLAHIYRPCFVDWMICLVTILFYELHIFDHQRAKFLLIVICVSCVLDFFWLFSYSAGWWSSTYETHTQPEEAVKDDVLVIEVVDSSYRRFAVWMSYLSFLIKFPLAFTVLRLWRALEDQLQGKTVVKEKLLNTLNFNRSPEYAATYVPYGNIQVPGQGSINKQYISNANQPVVQPYSFGNVQQSIIQQTPYNNLSPSKIIHKF